MTDWWEYPSNYSNGTVVDSVSKAFFKYPAYIIGDSYAIGIIIFIFSITFIINLFVGSRKSLLVASFISFIFSVYFVMLDKINMVVPILLIILGIIGALSTKDEGGYI